MSLVELILSNRLILINFAFVGLLLFTALLLSLIPQARRVTRAVRNSIRKQTHSVSGVAATASQPMNSLQAVDEASNDTEETDAAEPQPVQSGVATSTAQKPENPSSTGESKALQTIVSSVFEDEAALEKYANLLKDAEAIDAKNLAAACTDIAKQLRESVLQNANIETRGIGER